MSSQSPQLKRNAVGLGGAVVMSAALMGPAVSVYFNPQVVAGGAGAAMPFVFIVALAIMLVVATSITEMARVFPSAGSFYTYVSQGIGPKAGFVTGGLMFLAYALLVPAELALIGFYTSGLLEGYGIHVHWTIISAIFTVLMIVLSRHGISGSLKTAATLFGIEVGVIVLLSIIVLAQGGADGLTLEPLNPAASPTGLTGLALGMTFGILSFVGFEAATTLGEEVRRPRRNVPRAIILSLLLVGVIYVFCTYAEMVGFGVGNVDALTSDPAPFTTLAKTYAPWLEILIGLAGISSIFAVTMNSNNGIVRIVFAMGREGLLPASLGRVHPVRRTPSVAIWLVAVVSVVFTFGVGLLAGPFNAYVYLGSVLTLAIIPVYILTAIACIRYFSREGRAERSIVKHVVLPVLGIAALAIPIVGQVYPVPAAPLAFFPYLVLAFIAIMAIVAHRIGRARPEVLARAGTVLATGETEEELEQQDAAVAAADPEPSGRP
ncbi:APC family permease [Agromyces sp. G08B096]|uniref:APC family permease n=1 Tax=Agromyces sp. G08B096 TaxID=3156399 RepID=A0AAU7W5P7_9MICO